MDLFLERQRKLTDLLHRVYREMTQLTEKSSETQFFIWYSHDHGFCCAHFFFTIVPILLPCTIEWVSAEGSDYTRDIWRDNWVVIYLLLEHDSYCLT